MGYNMGKEYKQGNLWVVELDEQEWYSDKADKQAIQKEALDRAGIEGVSVVAIYVVPDELFPFCHTNKRHRVWEFMVPIPVVEPFSIETRHVVRITESVYNEENEKGRRAIVRRARDAVNELGLKAPGRYAIMFGDSVIESGRV